MECVRELYWLSFADKDKFRGVAMVYAEDFVGAVRTSIVQGCNAGPDTSVEGSTIPADYHIPQEFIGRLLSEEDIDQLYAQENV
jgi:hypothetical protein